MGTISDKLTYLNETKSQLKDMINYGLPTENQITNETTFRNYVKGIFKAFIESLRDSTTLYTNLPKISGNGTQITLNDTANAPIRITLNPSALSQDGTPTPSSPQDIHTISGDNSVTSFAKNLFDKTNITENFRLSSTGASYADNDYDRSEFVEAKSNTKYVFDALTDAECVCEYDSNQTFIKRTMGSDTTTITTNANTKYVRIAILKTNLNTFKMYDPYTSNTQTISLGNIEYCKIGDYEDKFILTSGKNLLDLTDLTYIKSINTTGTWSNNAYTINGITYTFNEGGTIKANGTSTGNAGLSLYGTSNNQKTINGKYILLGATINNMTMRILNYTGGYNYLGTNNSATTPTELDLSTYKTGYIEIMVYSGNTINNVLITPMLTDTSITTFEPYGTNQWYLKKNIGKVVLDGSETWSERTNAGGIKQFYAPTNLPVNSVLNATQICTHFNKYVQNLFNYGGVGQFAILTNTRQFIAGVEDTLLLEDFKTSLASNNLEIYYVLNTPTYTQITGTLETQLNNIYKNMLSYKGTTNVSQINNDLPFVLGVSAIQDLE